MLLTFEGIDGSGKSTQAHLLMERLAREGLTAVYVREPGGTTLGERVRSLLLDPSVDIDPVAEMMLFSAARAQVVARKILPALKQNSVVVCDRFYDSTSAYQGGGRRLADGDSIAALNRLATGGLKPDRTYLFRISPELAFERLGVRDGGETDRMESAGRSFFHRVADSYDQLAAAEPHRWRVLDGAESLEILANKLWNDVRGLLQEHRLLPVGSHDQ